MDELIEALRDAASKPYDMRDLHGRAGLLERAAAALEAARVDAERLGALERYVTENGGLVLHNGAIDVNYAGLGLANTGRTLRQAIDQMNGSRRFSRSAMADAGSEGARDD